MGEVGEPDGSVSHSYAVAAWPNPLLGHGIGCRVDSCHRNFKDSRPDGSLPEGNFSTCSWDACSYGCHQSIGFHVDARNRSISLVESPYRASSDGQKTRLRPDWDGSDYLIRARVHAGQEIALGRGNPYGALGEGRHVGTRRYGNLRNYFIGLRIDTDEKSFFAGDYPNAAVSRGYPSFGISRPRGNLGGNFPGLRVDADQSMCAATRNPDGAEPGGQPGTGLVDGNDKSGPIRGRIESHHVIDVGTGHPHGVVGNHHPVRLTLHGEGRFRVQVRHRALHARSGYAGARRTRVLGLCLS